MNELRPYIFLSATEPNAYRANSSHLETCSSGTTTHSFIGLPRSDGSNNLAPGRASASAWLAPPSLKTIVPSKYPANALPLLFFRQGIPNIFPLVAGDVAIISKTTASYAACGSKDIVVSPRFRPDYASATRVLALRCYMRFWWG